MTAAESADVAAVVNGPEDGTEFAITRTPFAIGSEPDCTVHVRLDHTIQGHHAQGSAVSDGYRIRSASGAPLYVNGKRAGRVKSRVWRDGDVLRVGYTDLILQCAPGGLARRSRGLVTESDWVWALRSGGGWLGSVTGGALRYAVTVLFRLTQNKRLLVVLTLAVLLVFFPGFREWVGGWILWVVELVRDALAQQ